MAPFRQVECRLSIGSKGLTNTKVNFQYFSVGDATKTVAFGPGLLPGTAPAVPVVFMIQARDKVIRVSSIDAALEIVCLPRARTARGVTMEQHYLQYLGQDCATRQGSSRCA